MTEPTIDSQELADQADKLAAIDDAQGAIELAKKMPQSTLFAAWLLYKDSAPNCAQVYIEEWERNRE
jgi:hypothetical protein